MKSFFAYSSFRKGLCTLQKLAVAGISGLVVLAASQQAWAADTWTTDVNAAALYVQQGNQASAITLLKDAQKAATSPYQQYESSRLLGKLYFDNRDYQNAELQLNAALGFSRQCPFVSATQSAQELYELTVKRGRNTEALKLHKLCEKLEKVDQSHDANFQGWGELLIKRIAEKLYSSPSAVSSGKRETATCRWVMSRAGRIMFVHLVKSSGNANFDETVASNVQNYSPPLALPEKAYDFEEVEIPFPQIPQYH
jgi:tetratricopeptide (TPR) repeat protein